MKLAKDLQEWMLNMKKLWDYEDILVRLAIENKAALQRLAHLMAKFEEPAHRQ